MIKHQNEKYYLIEKNVLPEVFEKVIKVKEGIRTNTYPSINQAVKEVGLSRSAYYKYHKSVFLYRGTDRDSVDVFNLLIEIDLVSQNEIISVLENNSAKMISFQQIPVTKGLSNIQISCRYLESDSSRIIIQQLTKINGIVELQHNPIRE